MGWEGSRVDGKGAMKGPWSRVRIVSEHDGDRMKGASKGSDII